MRGVRVNVQESDQKHTPLYIAATAGNKDAADLLLRRGANPDVEIEGQTIKELIVEKFGAFDFSPYEGMVCTMIIIGAIVIFYFN